MRMQEVEFENGLPIDGYGPGFFRIGGEAISGHILMLPAGVSTWAGFDDLDAVIAAKDGFDVLFIGMGADISHPPQEAQATLRAAGIAFEVMGTAPACRTYNVLLSEGRRVAAALISV